MKIKFLGAVRMVTGSCYLIETKGKKLLVDCGMFQGLGVEDKNYENFEFDPKEIDFVLLTHAHLDHCGLLPKLYKYGFRGTVHTTFPTQKIIEHMLQDSAKVQEYRFQDWNRERKRDWRLKSQVRKKQGKAPQIIYNTVDVFGLLSLVKPVAFKENIRLAKDLHVKFLRVGHALGAASVLVSAEGKTILFSGDIGGHLRYLDTRFDYVEKVDYVAMEALYWGRNHVSREDDEKKMIQAINQTLERGGKVLIPSFTLQRSQELLFVLKKFFQNGSIPSDVKVFLDSPLAIKVTNIYKQFYKYLDPEIIKNYKSGDDLFAHENFVFLQDSRKSRRVRKSNRAIFIAGNGMCAGGRILDHLAHNLEDSRVSVLFVGFQAPGTLGREILDGATKVAIGDVSVKVKADIVRLESFSAHADGKSLLKWLGHCDKDYMKKVFLMHAEEDTSLEFEKELDRLGYDSIVPKWKEEFEL